MSYRKYLTVLLASAVASAVHASQWETQWAPQEQNTPVTEGVIESYYDARVIQDKLEEDPIFLQVADINKAFPTEHFDFHENNEQAYHTNHEHEGHQSHHHHEKNHPAYRLRIGDRLTMAIYGEPHTKRSVVVDFTGSISYLLVDSLPAVGHTIDDVRKHMEQRLKKFYRNPVLIMTATEVLPDFYTIIGEARRPGKKTLIGNATLLSALAEGGGFNNRIFRNQTVDTVDLERSFISRRGKVLPVDFVKLVKCGDATQDVKLENGDYIYLASQQLQKVYVLGEIGSPSSIDVIDTITLTQAIALAGGINSFRASSRVAVIRGSLGCPEYFLIDINRILKGKACDFPLCPNDIVYVPPRKFQVLREIVFEAIRIFVATVASIAGTSAFVSVTPAATNVITPVPILNAGGTSTFIGTGAGSGVVIP